MSETTIKLTEKLTELLQLGADRIILSKPAAKTQPYRKAVLERKTGTREYWQLAKYTEKQVFHENIEPAALPAAAAALTEEQFLQLNVWTPEAEYNIMLSRKGQMTVRRAARSAPAADETHGAGHDRKKQYLLPEGTVVPPLVDMGVFTPDGRVVKAMYDKYRQINRFLEIIDDAVRDTRPEQLNIIDFGCGKSYLTFLVYYYLSAVRGIRVQMVGLDLKEDVIKNCNAATQRYGYDGLTFALGDINGYAAPFAVDMVLTLHACDTATDFALFNAVQWGARMIFSVPCCQHELNAQMHPETQTLLGRYGIIQERFAALATDAIRGRLLEYCGYKTQLLEFIDFAHTPKNILIRAVRRPGMPAGAPDPTGKLTVNQRAALDEVRTLLHEFHFTPTLYRLLGLDE
ncbi:MAG: SAM-dependent methyltransferase [Oscillospiraceae bacterium]|nr:SAM-dependent methyltransferase [Oscillospiraceae bacterium]